MQKTALDHAISELNTDGTIKVKPGITITEEELKKIHKKPILNSTSTIEDAVILDDSLPETKDTWYKYNADGKLVPVDEIEIAFDCRCPGCSSDLKAKVINGVFELQSIKHNL